MKPISTAAILAVLLAAPLAARQVPHLSLEEHIAACPLIVIGSIDTIKGRARSRIGGVHYVWKSELHVLKVIKGTPPKPLKIHWEETWIREVPEYSPGTKLIWMLMKNQKDGTFYAYRYDSTQSLSGEDEIERIVKKEAP